MATLPLPREFALQFGDEVSPQLRDDLAALADQLIGTNLDQHPCLCLLVVIYPFIQEADIGLDVVQQAELREKVKSRLDTFLAFSSTSQ